MSTRFVHIRRLNYKNSTWKDHLSIQLHIEFLIFRFFGSQKELESDINLTYPPFKLNRLRTTDP